MPKTLTKRDVLWVSSKIYDPLGFITTVSIRAKIFMQELWEEGYSWDDPLPEEMQNKWHGIYSDLKAATCFKAQWRYFPSHLTWPSNAVLHVFINASVKVYGTVAYLTAGPNSSLVMSKSHVTLQEVNLTTTRAHGSRPWSKISFLRKKTTKDTSHCLLEWGTYTGEVGD